MALSPQPRALKQCNRRKILAIRDGDNAVQICFAEKKIEQAMEGLRRIAFPLMLARESKSYLGLPCILFVDLQGAVSDQRLRLL